MNRGIFKFRDTGTAGALALSVTVPIGDHYQIISVTLNMSAAPTTSENFTITLDANAGSEYDTQIYALDLSTGSTTDLVFADGLTGWRDMILSGGDALDIAYPNTDGNTFGCEVTVRQI